MLEGQGVRQVNRFRLCKMVVWREAKEVIGFKSGRNDSRRNRWGFVRGHCNLKSVLGVRLGDHHTRG